MTISSATWTSSREALVDAIRAEFGGILAERILEAEAVDFLWDARVKERYLGQYLSDESFVDDTEEELSRITILSDFDRRWHVATCVVDGEGAAVDLLWKRSFEAHEQAQIAFRQAR
jgi:antirestriction protein